MTKLMLMLMLMLMRVQPSIPLQHKIKMKELTNERIYRQYYNDMTSTTTRTRLDSFHIIINVNNNARLHGTVCVVFGVDHQCEWYCTVDGRYNLRCCTTTHTHTVAAPAKSLSHSLMKGCSIYGLSRLYRICCSDKTNNEPLRVFSPALLSYPTTLFLHLLAHTTFLPFFLFVFVHFTFSSFTSTFDYCTHEHEHEHDLLSFWYDHLVSSLLDMTTVWIGIDCRSVGVHGMAAALCFELWWRGVAFHFGWVWHACCYWGRPRSEGEETTKCSTPWRVVGMLVGWLVGRSMGQWVNGSCWWLRLSVLFWLHCGPATAPHRLWFILPCRFSIERPTHIHWLHCGPS